MKQGFEWIKDNTPENSVILGQGHQVYSYYYGERMTADIPLEESELNNIQADYLIMHGFTQQRDFLPTYLANNQDKWQPITAFFFDESQQQPAFVIYKAA